MRLNLSRLSAFASPMIAVQAFEIAWRTYLPVYIATTGALSLASAGALLMALRLFDSVIDPAIAWASDRIPTRFGQRRPWLLLGLPPLLLGIPGVFFSTASNPVAFVLSALLLHLGYMMIVTPYGGWALELGAQAEDRLRLIAAKSWFGMVGLLLILVFPAVLERGFGVGAAGQVRVLGILVGVLFPATILLLIATIAEPRLPMRDASQPRNPLRLFAAILRMRTLWPVLGLYLCSGFAEAAGSAIFLLFVSEGLGLRHWGSALILAQGVIAVVTLPVWTKLSSRVARRTLLRIGYGWQLATAGLALVVPSASIGAAVIYVMLRGLMAGLDFLFLRVIVADIARASADEGAASGACFYSVSNLTLKLAFGVGAWVALSLLALVTGSQGLAAGHGGAVRLAFALPTAAAAVCALCLIFLAKGFASRPAVSDASETADETIANMPASPALSPI